MHPHLSSVLETLDHAGDDLRRAVERIGVSRAQLKPDPERWCAAEVLEHLALAEGSFTDRIASTIDAARDAGLGRESATERAELPDAIRTRLAVRTMKRVAPDRVRPTGTLDLASAWAAVDAQERRLRETLAGADGLALNEVIVQHPTLGAFTVYQFVELIAAHRRRHVAQIEEMAST